MKNVRSSVKDPFITVICDNYSSRDDLESSWGFSCLIQHEGQNILFDTGGDGLVLAANMAKLGIDPASLDLLMISHQHWDHTGGIYYILKEKRNLRICLPHSFSARFKEDMKRYGAEVIDINEAREVITGLHSTGDMEGPDPGTERPSENAGGNRRDYRMCASGHRAYCRNREAYFTG